MDYLFVIPARAGSKGIPGKNKKQLDGTPLIAYTIDCALSVTSASNICITTDDDEIISIAKSRGIDVPFKRPIELATDSASTFDVLNHALAFYEAKRKNIDAVVLLQPTSPFRTAKQLSEALEIYKHELDMVVSVNKASPKLNFIENTESFLELESDSCYYELRQEAKEKYCFNGAIYIINSQSLKNKKMLEYTKIRKYEMDTFTSFDIDTPLDWEIAEYLIKKRKSA